MASERARLSRTGIVGSDAAMNVERVAELGDIQAYSRRIVEQFHPDKIVLFGSHAYGVPTRDSDVDLLVIMPYTGLAPYKALEIVQRTDPPLPIDLLVRSSEQIAERVALNDFFVREIMERGRVLYAAPDA